MEDHAEAVLRLWVAREEAATRAAENGSTDVSLRAGVVSGKHLDEIAALVGKVFVDAGMPLDSVYFNKGKCILPGFYRAEKCWDIVVIYKGALVAAVEFKSMLGSVGNNLNNRMEESIGSAADLQEAAAAGLIGDTPPWLGYVYIIEDLDDAKKPKKVVQPHFDVDPEFVGATYEKRLELYLRRLVMKRLYDAAWLAVGNPTMGTVREPATDLSWAKFEAAIRGRVGQILA